MKLDDLNKQQREQVQKEIEKLLKEMTPEQREELRKQIQEQMQKQEQAFRKTMGRIGGGGSLDHAARALLMALKSFRLAFKNEPGVEVRVVAYNENPQRSIIGNYMQVKDLSDAVLYNVVERLMPGLDSA